MLDQDKSKQQLIEGLAEMRRRVAALETLRESEERYRLLAESIPQMLWRADVHRQTIECNHRWCEYTGQSPEEARGLGWMKTLHPDDVAQAAEQVQAAQAASEPYQAEYRVRRASDGSYRWHLSRAIPMKDEDGSITGWFGSVTDIEDQKRAEEALKKAHDELEQRVKERTAELATANENLAIFKQFAESASEGFGMTHLDGRIAYANPSMCRLFGEEKPEDVIGNNASTYSPEDYMQRRNSEMLPALLRDGHWHVEDTVLPRHGKPIPILQSTFLIRDESGNPFRVAAVVSDITERKRAEEALRQSRDELQAMYDGMFDGLLIVDLESKRFARANASICRILGYSEAELLSMSVMDIHPAEDVPRILERIQARAEGRIQGHVDLSLLRKDGSLLCADVVSSRLDYDGRPSIAAFFRDITDRKRAEEALAKEHRNLKHLLQSSDHERQLIAYEIHDGLAQQLAGAIMQIQAFAHLKDNNPKQAAKAYDAGLTMLQQAHFETRRLIAGVRPPILDEAGVAEAISHLVHEQGRDEGPKIENHSSVDFDRLDPTLENAIYRIAQEALTNACQHSKSERISVSLRQRGDRVRIEIRDWGFGFDPKAVPKSHFGLEGIRQRARLLGGKCSIRSAAGKGARLTVELPVVLRDEEQ